MSKTLLLKTITLLKTFLEDLNTLFINWKIQCCKDISSPKTELHIQKAIAKSWWKVKG